MEANDTASSLDGILRVESTPRYYILINRQFGNAVRLMVCRSKAWADRKIEGLRSGGPWQLVDGGRYDTICGMLVDFVCLQSQKE